MGSAHNPASRLRGTGRARGYRVRVPPRARPLIRRVAVASGAIALGVWLLVAAPASAAPTCVFDQVGGAVTIAVGDGETAVIAVANGEITLNGTACEAATVSTTDSIAVDATGTPAQIDIDLTGGDFGPGPHARGGRSLGDRVHREPAERHAGPSGGGRRERRQPGVRRPAAST